MAWFDWATISIWPIINEVPERFRRSCRPGLPKPMGRAHGPGKASPIHRRISKAHGLAGIALPQFRVDRASNADGSLGYPSVSSFLFEGDHSQVEFHSRFRLFRTENSLPVISIVATIVGIIMMLGHGSFRFILQFFRRVLRRRKDVEAVSHPHFQVRDQEPARTTTRP